MIQNRKSIAFRLMYGSFGSCPSVVHDCLASINALHVPSSINALHVPSDHSPTVSVRIASINVSAIAT